MGGYDREIQLGKADGSGRTIEQAETWWFCFVPGLLYDGGCN